MFPLTAIETDFVSTRHGYFVSGKREDSCDARDKALISAFMEI